MSEICSGRNFAPGEGPGYLFHLQTKKKPRKIKGSIFSGLIRKSVLKTTSFSVLAFS
jgi:hypothetical protein